LDPFIAADPSFDLDDFFPTAVAQFTAQGQLWGVPASLNPIIIEFNKELFDASSIPYPTPEWTMDEFLNIGVTLTTGEGQAQQYGFVPDVAEHVLLKEMMVLQGASLLDTSKDPPSTAFTTPEIVDALRWYTNLNREFSIKPTFQAEIGGNDSRELTIFLSLLEEGRAAMWTAYTVPIPPEIYENLNIGAVPLPRSVDHSPLNIQSAGYYISASTEQRQACWQWITHLTESVDVISGVPARRSVAESNAYRQKVGIDRASTYLATLNRLDELTSLESSIDTYWWMFPYELWLAKAHDQIVINSIGVEDALVSAQQTFDAYRTCVIESDAFDDRDRQYQCAIEVDPSLAAILGG
jgi:ABC-type glycerol-3-phosphate transport system substrate-binding protein